MFFGVVREIKITSDWLRCILVILLNIAKVFAESVAYSSTCLADRLDPDILLVLRVKGQVLHRKSAHLKVPGC